VAAASVSHRTSAVALTVSESSMVRVFDDGELISEITPELWMLGRYSSYLEGLPSTTRRGGDEVTVVSRTE
jgi:diadenylate cyclase